MSAQAWSFVVEYWPIGGRALLGWILHVARTRRFSHEEDARIRLHEIIQANAEVGLQCAGHLVRVEFEPEIARHGCGSHIPQSLGQTCFRCGEVID